MKVRLTAIFAVLSLAAWLPASAQQTAAPEPATPAAKSACTCCNHQKSQGRADAGKAASCCEGKDAGCCSKDKNSASAGNCCSGKDAKQCATESGKDCCGKTDKSCCGKDAMACNTKDGKNCCGSDSSCCHST